MPAILRGCRKTIQRGGACWSPCTIRRWRSASPAWMPSPVGGRTAFGLALRPRGRGRAVRPCSSFCDDPVGRDAGDHLPGDGSPDRAAGWGAGMDVSTCCPCVQPRCTPTTEAYLISGSRARNSSVAARRSHSKRTISVVTMPTPAAHRRSMAACRFSDVRDDAASATR